MYLHLTLAHSEGQSQGHANFDCEYLVTVTDLTNSAIAHTKEVPLLAFDWYIYILSLLIVKVKINCNSILEIRETELRWMSAFTLFFLVLKTANVIMHDFFYEIKMDDTSDNWRRSTSYDWQRCRRRTSWNTEKPAKRPLNVCVRVTAR